jgi:hypothetical protein
MGSGKQHGQLITKAIHGSWNVLVAFISGFIGAPTFTHFNPQSTTTIPSGVRESRGKKTKTLENLLIVFVIFQGRNV